VTILLANAPSNIDAQTNNGDTPLLLAVEKGYAKVTVLLVYMGRADITIKNNNGDDARTLATKKCGKCLLWLSPSMVDARSKLRYCKENQSQTTKAAECHLPKVEERPEIKVLACPLSSGKIVNGSSTVCDSKNWMAKTGTFIAHHCLQDTKMSSIVRVERCSNYGNWEEMKSFLPKDECPSSMHFTFIYKSTKH
jgi:hypothetical protein